MSKSRGKRQAAIGSTGGGSGGGDLTVAAVQARLQALADPDTKAGQDAYFKGAILNRGIKVPAVEAACKALLRQPEAADADALELRRLGQALLEQPLQEDKLAGMVVWQHCLLKRGLARAQWRHELDALQALYGGGHVAAWSTCDGICGRLLAPLVKDLLAGDAPEEGAQAARRLLGWCRQDNLWLRRSSVVAFVTLARKPDEQVFSGFRAGLLESLAAVVRGQERFAQTGAGWVLRELGKGDSPAMLRFVEANLPHFSCEGLRYALEHQPADVRQQLAQRHKQAARQAGAQAQQEAAAPAKRQRWGA